MDWNMMGETLGELLGLELITLAGNRITVGSALAALLILAASFLVSFLLRKGARRTLKARGVDDRGTVGVISRLLHYAVIGIGIGVAIQALGIDIGALFAAGAIFAVGLGFAMQNIAQNFVAGVILLVERAIKPGDVLDVEGSVVRVEKMGIRSTVVKSLDGEEMIVPNSILVQSSVTNYTLADSTYRLRVPVGVTYSSDMALVRETLEEVARSVEFRDEEPEPVVLMTGFGSSSVDFEVSIWISDPWRMRRVRSQLHEAVWHALKDREVVIAFPQVDVHLDPPVMDSLGRLAGRAA